jgi:hypothetical protein
LNNSLLCFLEHMSLYFLLIIEDGICNVTLRLVQHALLFPSGLLHYYHIMTFVDIDTPNFLLPKNYSRKKAKL